MSKHGKIRVICPMSVPIAMMLCRIAKVRMTVNKTVEWKENQAKISPGLLLETLVVCILCAQNDSGRNKTCNSSFQKRDVGMNIV